MDKNTVTIPPLYISGYNFAYSNSEKANALNSYISKTNKLSIIKYNHFRIRDRRYFTGLKNKAV